MKTWSSFVSLVTFETKVISRLCKADFFRNCRQSAFTPFIFPLLAFCLALSGCAGGGYPGGGITGLSASSLVIDAGQSVPLTSTLSGNFTVSWSMSGSSCTGSACGNFSASTGNAVTYTAPSNINSQMQVVILAAIKGTKSQDTVNITINPDPAFSGDPLEGTVGVPYSTTIPASGGTGPLTTKVASGSLPPGLTYNAASGVISGSPTTAGTYNFALQLTDSSSVPFALNANESITIVNPVPPLTLIGGPQPLGEVGVAYSTSLSASGGVSPYSWSIVAGTLSPGLNISPSTGLISGTPTTAGTSNFTVQVKDSTGSTVSAGASITVVSPLTLAGGLQPSGTVGLFYSTSLVASGGITPYSWSVVSGALPAGLSISATTGVISGTPTTAGTSTFTVQVKDNAGANATASASITIIASLALTNTLPNGTVGVVYSATIGASGGATPYTCTIIGSLPAGLDESNCTVSGTPTTAGTSTVNVKVVDSSNPAQSVSANETIVISPALLTLVGTLPNGTVGVAYNATIGASGGTAPNTCSISGSLPAGLSLNGCAVSGTPTAAGPYPITITVTDSGNPAQHASANETIVISPAALVLTNTLPNGTVGVAYSSTIGATGGIAPYSCSINGSLPAGLSLNACTVGGTPTTAGSSTVTVTVTDAANPQQSVSANETIVIAPATLTITNLLPNGTENVPYNATITASGGTTPYTCSITGNLPAGLTENGCTVSGTPTTPGSAAITVKVADSGNPAQNASADETIVIAPAALALSGTLPNGTVGVPYSATIGATGGVTPYQCSVTGLPTGLSLSGCTVSGTPSAEGSYPVTVKVTDSSSTPQSVNGNETIVIAPAALTVTGTLPNGTVGVAYSANITASDGTPPYACSITGTLPAGLSLSGCTVSGTPTSAGSSTVTVQVADSGAPKQNATASDTIVISPAQLALSGTLPNGTVGVAYSASLGITGGTTPYTCSITAGTLPSGLMLNGCTVSGNPTTAGSSTISVKVVDAGNPAQNVSGNQTIVINPGPLTLTGNLSNGTVGVSYSATIGASGGTQPYTCSITSGTLPAGLTLNGCTVSGTPTTAGSSTVAVKVTDSGNPAQSVSGNETIVINPAPLTITGSLPNGSVGEPYSATIGASGGTQPYTCSVTGTLPSGLILTGCTISGTPTSAGSSTITVTVTDSGNPAQTATSTETVVINPAPLKLTTSSLPDGTIGVPYSATIGVSGGTSPYSCSITSGSLPAGLTLSGCTVSGTPTTAGSSTVTVQVTDSGNPAQTTSGPETIVIQPAALAISSTFPDGTVGVAYSTNITATGGTNPYSCSISSGTLPAGLNLNGCTVSGTPTTAGTSDITVQVTDSTNPQKSVSSPQSITIHPSGALSLTGTLPIATVGVPYTYTLKATGGTPTYSYALTAGSLPPGITLNADGTISGTPTAPGASSFTVEVTDSASTPATASLPLILLVQYASTPYDSELKGPYAYLFQGYDDVVSGVLAYHTDTVGSFTADGSGGINMGELDANHQSSNPEDTTVASQDFLGTYVVNSDNRGFITITTLNPDGTTDQTSTYAISIKAPVSPSTISTQGSLIESDNNQQVGTKGSGTLLAQTASAFAAGLNGHYAFGLSGDTPCLISCTVGIGSGPVATVGQFATDGAGNISSGTADANIASFNFANAPLSGSYQTADANGRVQLQLTNLSISDGLYPSDFAVYLVNANEAFIMSTDKHSAYTLLAGTAQLQTQASFSNSSMNGPFIGYENAPVNPGLLGTVLKSVLNYSTATIFRASGNGSGTCDTTNVDVAGLTSAVDSLNGLGITDQTNLIKALLGSYDATGSSSCNTSSTGRGTLNYPDHSIIITLLLESLGLPTGSPSPRVFYLVSPEKGYFIETSYAALGQFEPQTGAPFSLGSFDGTYVVGNVPASSLSGINTSGSFTADGNGNVSDTLDENLGVGTINVLQFGTTGSTTYSLSDPGGTVSAATAGRYVFANNTTVLYAISPGRFVEVDTSPLTLSPSVSILY